MALGTGAGRQSIMVLGFGTRVSAFGVSRGPHCGMQGIACDDVTRVSGRKSLKRAPVARRPAGACSSGEQRCSSTYGCCAWTAMPSI
jgi:hypothetical protein